MNTEPQNELVARTPADAMTALMSKLADALTPGFRPAFDPDEAARAGAFREDALDEQDAADSEIDSINAAR